MFFFYNDDTKDETQYWLDESDDSGVSVFDLIFGVFMFPVYFVGGLLALIFWAFCLAITVGCFYLLYVIVF